MRLILITATCLLFFQCQTDQPQWEDPWNGENLDGWVKFLGTPHTSVQNIDLARDSTGKYSSPLGIGNDPLNVFSVVELENEKVIRVSGQIFGTIHTKDDYGNFHLKLKYKWG